MILKFMQSQVVTYQKTGVPSITNNGIAIHVQNDPAFVLNWFIQTLQRTPATQLSYRKSLELYFKWLNEHAIRFDNVTDDVIIAYKNYLEQKTVSIVDNMEIKMSKTSINQYLCALRKFYRWCEAKNICLNSASTVLGYRLSSDCGFVKEPLTVEEGKALLKYYVDKEYTPENRHSVEIHFRDIAIIKLLLQTGLRTIEINRALREDFRQEFGSYVLYVQGKGRQDKKQYVIIPNGLYGTIMNYLEARGPIGPKHPLFCDASRNRNGRPISTRSIQRIVKEGLRAIGLNGKEYSPHSLRHTTAFQLLNNGKSIYEIQTVLRHADPKTTARYLHTANMQTRINANVEGALDNMFD